MARHITWQDKQDRAGPAEPENRAGQDRARHPRTGEGRAQGLRMGQATGPENKVGHRA